MKKLLPQILIGLENRKFLFVLLFITTFSGFSQTQAIGSFTYMNGGFEGQAAGAMGTALSTTAWSRQSQSGSSSNIATTSPRSGANYASVTSAATVSRNLQSPQSATAAAGPAASTSYVVQFFVKNAATVASFQGGVTTNGTSNPVYSTAATLAVNAAWAKQTYVLTTTGTAVSSAGIGIAGRAGAGTFDVDDFVIYAGAAADVTAPNSAGTVTVNNATTSSLDVSWGAASGGVDGGGYVVVRYASAPNADNDPNQNGIYGVGNTTTNGTGALTGTVRYVGTGTSFTDSGLTLGAQYWYKVYTVDKAFNYAVESEGNGITTGAGAPALTISGTPTNHGSVCPLSSAASVQYTITNTGSVQADGINVASNDPQFVVSGLSNTSIAASGGTVTYNVTFTPSSAGGKSATITVTSTTSGSNSPTSGLTGTGTTPVTQAVSSSAASGVNNTTATLNGNVTALGVCPSTTQKGFVYSETATNADPLNGGTGVTTTPVAGLATGAFNLPLSSLATGTGYSYKAYVYDGTNYSYGAVTTFTTLLPANHLTFVGVPSSGNINTAIGSFTVEARRPDSSVDTNYTGNVTISKASGPGALSGTLTVAAVAGVATFSTAQFDTVGVYTLSVASGALTTDTSGNITINLAPVALGVYTFTGTACSAGALAASSVVSHVTFAAASVTGEACNANSSTSYSVGGTSWGTAFSATRYVQVAITPATGYYFDLSTFTFDILRSGAGAQTASVRSSVDNFAADLIAPFTVNTGSANKSVTLGGASFSNLTGTVTFRIYGWGGNSTGDLRLDNITVNGNVFCIQPNVFNVTGGATVCSAGPGTAIGLSGSQSIMTYQLKIGGVDSGSPVAGTGSALNFGNFTTGGTYTVEAINSNGSCNVTVAMNGNAVVVADAAPVGGTLAGGTTVCAGANSGALTLSGQSGTITKWQSSTVSDFSANVTDIAVTIDTYNYTNVNTPTYYRVELSNGICPVTYSTTAFIDVQENFWTGTVDTDWNTAGNWNCGSVPGFATDVTIVATANQPVIANNVTVNSLTLEANTSLTVQTGYNLTVTNALSVDATADMELELNANLIQSADVNNSGAITVNRDSGALMRLDYVLWSSPVVGQNLQDFSPATSSNRFYVYNPGTDVYNAIDASATDFAEGTGYLIRMPNNHPATPTVWSGQFVGEPHNGNVDITVASNTYNAVGNPYPSTIDADLFISGNSLTEALYFWRKTNAAATTAYATYTLAGGAGTDPSPGDPNGGVPNGIIQVGQGFIARSTGTTLSFNNGMRVADNNGQFFRTSQIERNRIWVNLTNTEGVFSQTMVSYMTGATQGVDAAIDGLYFNDSQIALTSLIGTSEYTVQGRALPFTTADVVPMGFKVLAAGTYTIALDRADGLFEDGSQAVILKDLLAGTEQNLREGNYTFTSDAGVFNNRFEIVYQTTLATNNPVWNASQVAVYNQNKQIVIHSGNAQMSKVEVFDVRGRLLAAQHNINAFETRLTAGAANQVLMVRITSIDGKVVTKKVVN